MRKSLPARRRDPRTKRERRAIQKVLLERAGHGDREAAEVLIDQVHEDDPTLAEDLALALQGRAYIAEHSGIHPELVFVQRGDPLPPNRHLSNLDHALQQVKRRLFPRRAAPCMPNRKALLRLFESIHGDIETDHEQGLFLRLWSELKVACNSNRLLNIGGAMSRANDLLRGHGVEQLDVLTRRRGRRRALYVNQGDTYNNTLIYDLYTARFLVTSWGDLVEAWERRWGRAEEP